MIVLIDNYDSFTYNLVQRFGELNARLPMVVFRNDQVTLEQLDDINPTHVIISPGPCSPKEAGLSNEILKHFAPKVPTFGVCLGHQCIGHSFGGEVIRNWRIMHGKVSPIHHDGKGLFAGMSNPFDATRYHSLVINRDSFHNPDFEVSAWTAEGEIMGVRHKTWPLHGVQFHPESFLTVEGPKILQNFLDLAPWQ
ncbi:anthranilate synthase component II [Zavarzinella formosa]|uniref:anthranilate synthase component II n=1 Tax=Zavarzinella formosa TaxID=360055 RepID=UPI00031AF2FF|nr:aminodeoxychorismate/anthranilate synthase component II [Zavarzinella formosa]